MFTEPLASKFDTWFNTGRKQNIEDLSRKLSILTFKGIKGLASM